MVAVSLLLLIFLSGCSGVSMSEPATEQYQPDQIYELYSGTISESISASGILSSDNEIKVQGMSDVPVSCIFVRKGDVVKKGDKLFSYDFSEIQSELDELKQEYDLQSKYIEYQHSLNCRNLEQARSSGNMNISQAQDDLNKALNERDVAYSYYNSIIEDINSAVEQFPPTDEGTQALEARYAELWIEEEVAAERISSTEAAVIQADRILEVTKRESETNIQTMQDNIDAEKYDTSLSQLKKQIQEIEEKIATDTVLAPENGIISELNVTGSETIHGEVAVVITSCDNLFATVQVSRSDIAMLSPGSRAEILSGEGGDAVTATVSRISHIAEPDTDTFTVELTPDYVAEASEVFLGMEVTSRIYTTNKENVLKAPYTCIRTDEGQNYYVLKLNELPDGTTETIRVPVQLGISTATEAEISSDELHSGDRLIMK